MRVSDVMLECRNIPNATVWNGDTPQDALWHTINSHMRLMNNSKVEGWAYDPEPKLKAIAQLIELCNKPVEIWME